MTNFVEANTSDANKTIFKDKDIEASKPQFCLAWDTYHKVLYSGDEQGTISKWSLKESAPLGTFEGPSKSDLKELSKNAEDIKYAADASDAAKPNISQDQKSGDEDPDRKSMTMSSRKKEEEKKGFIGLSEKEDIIRHKEGITELLPLPKLLFLASASFDQQVILWDTITRKARRVYTAHKKAYIFHASFYRE